MFYESTKDYLRWLHSLHKKKKFVFNTSAPFVTDPPQEKDLDCEDGFVPYSSVPEVFNLLPKAFQSESTENTALRSSNSDVLKELMFPKKRRLTVRSKHSF